MKESMTVQDYNRRNYKPEETVPPSEGRHCTTHGGTCISAACKKHGCGGGGGILE
tara:strand:+ start:355 stop:519 length:165 start_codon:yes stop_codon:yes gene_type:complete